VVLALADVKAVEAELSRLNRLVESRHPWQELMLQAGYVGSGLLRLAPQAETPLERRAIVVGLQAIALAAEVGNLRP